MPKIPDDYRVQNGCHNCEFVFRFAEYDERDTHCCREEYTYYCHIDGSDRPPSGSVAMGEYSVIKNGKDFFDVYDKWDGWCGGRGVEAGGICSQHKLKLLEEAKHA